MFCIIVQEVDIDPRVLPLLVMPMMRKWQRIAPSVMYL